MREQLSKHLDKKKKRINILNKSLENKFIYATPTKDFGYETKYTKNYNEIFLQKGATNVFSVNKSFM